MRAIIGKYAVNIDGHRLICTHPTGISFDLTIDEALGLMRFIVVYQDALIAAQHHSQSEVKSDKKSETTYIERIEPVQDNYDVDTSINFLQQEEKNE